MEWLRDLAHCFKIVWACLCFWPQVVYSANSIYTVSQNIYAFGMKVQYTKQYKHYMMVKWLNLKSKLCATVWKEQGQYNTMNMQDSIVHCTEYPLKN